MPRRLTSLVIGAFTSALVLVQAWAQAAPEITLTRLDCGTPRAAATDPGINFSDTFASSIPNIRLVFSCYLIKHDDDYMVWDTGFGMNAGPVAPKASLVDYFRFPEICFVGLGVLPFARPFSRPQKRGSPSTSCRCSASFMIAVPDGVTGRVQPSW
jgi:hypothetical protein